MPARRANALNHQPLECGGATSGSPPTILGGIYIISTESSRAGGPGNRGSSLENEGQSVSEKAVVLSTSNAVLSPLSEQLEIISFGDSLFQEQRIA